MLNTISYYSDTMKWSLNIDWLGRSRCVNNNEWWWQVHRKRRLALVAPICIFSTIDVIVSRLNMIPPIQCSHRQQKRQVKDKDCPLIDCQSTFYQVRNTNNQQKDLDLKRTCLAEQVICCTFFNNETCQIQVDRRSWPHVSAFGTWLNRDK